MPFKKEQALWHSTAAGWGRRNDQMSVQESSHSGQCQVRMKQTWTGEGEKRTVTLERLDDNQHTHSLQTSFDIRRPSYLKNLIAEEAKKGYARADIFHAFRGIGKGEPMARLELAGGAALSLADVHNAAKRVKRADERVLLPDTPIGADIGRVQTLLEMRELTEE